MKAMSDNDDDDDDDGALMDAEMLADLSPSTGLNEVSHRYWPLGPTVSANSGAAMHVLFSGLVSFVYTHYHLYV